MNAKLINRAKEIASEIIGKMMVGEHTEKDIMIFGIVMPYLYPDYKFADQMRGTY